jgi:hypothetical protein
MAQRACAPIRACDYSHRIAVDRVSLEKTAYRWASLSLTIIVLIPRSARAQTIALHRFLEVSVGITVALAVVALWPDHQPSAVKSAGE